MTILFNWRNTGGAVCRPDAIMLLLRGLRHGQAHHRAAVRPLPISPPLGYSGGLARTRYEARRGGVALMHTSHRSTTRSSGRRMAEELVGRGSRMRNPPDGSFSGITGRLRLGDNDFEKQHVRDPLLGPSGLQLPSAACGIAAAEKSLRLRPISTNLVVRLPPAEGPEMAGRPGELSVLTSCDSELRPPARGT